MVQNSSILFNQSLFNCYLEPEHEKYMPIDEIYRYNFIT